MRVSETIENYLETIYMLFKKGQPVRSIDVVHAMSLSRPSVSVMMKQLREKGLVTMNDAGHICLTTAGLKIAQGVYERHVLLTEALVNLGVDRKTAREDACKIEHVLSPQSFASIKKHLLKRGLEAAP